MEVLHRGFDKLEVSFTGAMSANMRAKLDAAKQKSLAMNCPAVIELNGVECWVKDKGASGGYQYVFETTEGDMWAVKNSGDKDGWNLRCIVSAYSCAVDGLSVLFGRIRSRLDTWSTNTKETGVSRIDFAVDFMCDGFCIRPELMVCHSRMNQASHREVIDASKLTEYVNHVGRTINSYRLGSMPNKQVAIYDKTREVRAGNKREWFKIWGYEPEKNETVWRIEVRAGKDCLKDHKIRSFEDVEEKIGSLFSKIMTEIRMLSYVPETIDNVSRIDVSEVWELVRAEMEMATGVLPAECTKDDLKEVARDRMSECYRKMIIGCMAGYSVTLGHSDQDFLKSIIDEIRQDFDLMIEADKSGLIKKFKDARTRFKFVEPVRDQDNGGMSNDSSTAYSGACGMPHVQTCGATC